MFHEIIHLAKTYLISPQYLKKVEISYVQFLIYFSIIYFLYFNFILFF